MFTIWKSQWKSIVGTRARVCVCSRLNIFFFHFLLLFYSVNIHDAFFFLIFYSFWLELEVLSGAKFYYFIVTMFSVTMCSDLKVLGVCLFVAFFFDGRNVSFEMSKLHKKRGKKWNWNTLAHFYFASHSNGFSVLYYFIFLPLI